MKRNCEFIDLGEFELDRELCHRTQPMLVRLTEDLIFREVEAIQIVLHSYYITDWIGCIAEWLSKLGYHLDGKMFAVVEGGMSYYTITVDGDKVTSEEFIPDATYVDEFYACEESEDT